MEHVNDLYLFTRVIQNLHLDPSINVAKTQQMQSQKRKRCYDWAFFTTYLPRPHPCVPSLFAIRKRVTYLWMCWPVQRPKQWPKGQGAQGFVASWWQSRVIVVAKKEGTKVTSIAVVDYIRVMGRQKIASSTSWLEVLRHATYY